MILGSSLDSFWTRWLVVRVQVCGSAKSGILSAAVDFEALQTSKGAVRPHAVRTTFPEDLQFVKFAIDFRTYPLFPTLIFGISNCPSYLKNFIMPNSTL